MELQAAFSLYEGEIDAQPMALRRLSLALRRGGVDTLERLWEIYCSTPQQLKQMRDIGPKSMVIIDDILQFYEVRGLLPLEKRA